MAASRNLSRPLLRVAKLRFSPKTSDFSTLPSFRAAAPAAASTPRPSPRRSCQPSEPSSSSAANANQDSPSSFSRPSPSSSYDPETRPQLSSADVAAAQKLAALAPSPPAPPSEIDWTRSYHGLGERPFPREVADVLTQPIKLEDIECKPDGILYLPEIKYRRILNAAFGPGGWGLVPKGDAAVGERIVTREYALVAEGRFVSQAQGENQYFTLEGLPAAVEGCKSNALMRCCKDVGVASELWDPVFIRDFKKQHVEQVWVEHVPTKKKKQLWVKKGLPVSYPYKKT